jgi:hypothetical protein
VYPRRRIRPDPNLREKTEFARRLMMAPEHVIVDVSPMTNRMSSMFTASIEFIFENVVDALHDKHQIPHNLRLMNRHLENILCDESAMFGPAHLDKLLTIEQCALDIGDVFDQYKLYLYGRFLPYQFENVLTGGALMLRRVDDFGEFCLRAFVELGFDEGE